jgi:hypothetical protein
MWLPTCLRAWSGVVLGIMSGLGDGRLSRSTCVQTYAYTIPNPYTWTRVESMPSHKHFLGVEREKVSSGMIVMCKLSFQVTTAAS